MVDGGYFISYPVHGYSFAPVAPERKCCSSSMTAEHQVLQGPQSPSPLSPFADPHTELLSPGGLDSHQDFITAPPFTEHTTAQSDFNPSLDLGGEMFSPQPYVGQATVAGIFGLGDTISDSHASPVMPQLWSAVKSDIAPSVNALSVNPDFKTNATSFSTMAPPRTVHPFETTAAAMGRPPKPECVGDCGLPEFEARYRHQSLTKDSGFKTSQGVVPSGMNPPNDFAKLDIEPMDFFADLATSSGSYNSPNIGACPGYFP
jgi:hypothetical protein